MIWIGLSIFLSVVTVCATVIACKILFAKEPCEHDWELIAHGDIRDKGVKLGDYQTHVCTKCKNMKSQRSTNL